MKRGTSPFIRRPLLLAVVGILMVVLAACTGRGGGYLPLDGIVYKGQASFGFMFSCENGELKIQLAYTDKGRNPIGSSFGIHGVADVVDPVLESAVCIDENPPPPPENQLIFLGRYRLISGSPRPLATCPKEETSTSPMCRFEVIVQDNDRSRTPSSGDTFSIKLSTIAVRCDAPTLEELDPTCSILPYPGPMVPYFRGGNLAGGNLTVD
jgi:hypothetical protein